MALAYCVEELLALRDTVSETAVALGRFGDEEAIKGSEMSVRNCIDSAKGRMNTRPLTRLPAIEENLQMSAPAITSANAENQHPFAAMSEPHQGSDSRNEIVSPPGLSQSTNLPKASPTPSVKRGKAERLLKEHGSPPGMRVTAGGQVVRSDGHVIPTDSAPVGSPPRTFYHHKKSQDTVEEEFPKHVMINGEPHTRVNVPNGVVGLNTHGQYRQIVDGRVVALDLRDGVPQLRIAAPNYPFPGGAQKVGAPPTLTPAYAPSGQPLPHSDQYNPSVGGPSFVPFFPQYFEAPFALPYQPYLPQGMAPAPAKTGGNNKTKNVPNKQGGRAGEGSAGASKRRSTPKPPQAYVDPAFARLYDLVSQHKQITMQLATHRREEVLLEEVRSPAEKQAAVEKKKKLVIAADQLRRAILKAQDELGVVVMPPEKGSVKSQSHASHSSKQGSQTKHQEIVDAANPAPTHMVGPQAVNDPQYLSAYPGHFVPAQHVGYPAQMLAVAPEQMPMAGYPQVPQPYQQFVSYGPVPHFQQGEPVIYQQIVGPHPSNPQGYPVYHHGEIVQDLGSQQAYNGYENGVVYDAPSHGPGTAVHSPMSFSARKSHAVEIKAPQGKENQVHSQKSSLNPTSPEYEPKKTVLWLPPSPPMIPTPEPDETLMKTNPWLYGKNSASSSTDAVKSVANRTSRSSIATSDFFPHNPAEHSSTNHSSQRKGKGHISGSAAGSHSQKTPTTPRVPPGFEHLDSDEEKNDQLMNRSESYMEGFRVGLSRAPPVGRSSGKDFDEGYCAGLMRSQVEEPPSAAVPAQPNNLTKKSSSASVGTCDANEDSGAAGKYFECMPMPRKYLSTGELAARSRENEAAGETTDSQEQAIADQETEQASAGLGHTSISGPASAYYGHEEPTAMTERAAGSSIWVPHPNGFSAIHQLQHMTPMNGQALDGNFGNGRATPLARQHSGNQIAGVQQLSGPHPGTYRTPSAFGMYGQQNNGKSGYSVAPASEQARGLIHQYDGAMDDLAEMMGCTTPPSKPVGSRGAKNSGKASVPVPLISTSSPEKSPSRSPLKSLGSPKWSPSTSPAKAKLENLASMMKKSVKTGEDQQEEAKDPQKMSEKQKKKWREQWKKRFQEIKAKEKEQIENYKLQNPIV